MQIWFASQVTDTRHEPKIGFAEIHEVEKTGKIDEKQDSGRVGRNVTYWSLLIPSGPSARRLCQASPPRSPPESFDKT